MQKTKACKSLKEAYRDYFLIGATVEPFNLERYSSVLKEHFNSITLENALKWDSTQKKQGAFDFSGADQCIDFAVKNNMKIRGHTLVWHGITPKWVFYDEQGSIIDKERLLERMKEHIHTVMGRYKGKIYCWDVVNEAIENRDNGKQYVDCEWLRICGPDYIKKAFVYAHEADPEALLFYNDYQVEFSIKRAKTLRMIKEMQQEGIPIHGVGIQSHTTMNVPSLYEIKAAIEEFASLGLQIHISEIDISVYDYRDESRIYRSFTPELAEKQARRYEEIFRIFREYKKEITSVTFWGVADDHTWLDSEIRKSWPFVFDENLAPKPAFYKITDF